MTHHGIRMPGDRNPAAPVERYKEPAPQIRCLTLEQIDEQLAALADNPQLQAKVATLIYAGLRRAELLWLTLEDVMLPPGRPGLIQVRAKTVRGEYRQPKTKKNRAVPISADLHRYLDAYAPRLPRGDWFFPSPQRWRKSRRSVIMTLIGLFGQPQKMASGMSAVLHLRPGDGSSSSPVGSARSGNSSGWMNGTSLGTCMSTLRRTTAGRCPRYRPPVDVFEGINHEDHAAASTE
jgi:hypothetical protein